MIISLGKILFGSGNTGRKDKLITHISAYINDIVDFKL